MLKYQVVIMCRRLEVLFLLAGDQLGYLQTEIFVLAYVVGGSDISSFFKSFTMLLYVCPIHAPLSGLSGVWLWNYAMIQISKSLLCAYSSLSQLFLRPSQTTILPFCISFPRGWS